MKGAYENAHEHLDGIEIELCWFLRQRTLRAPVTQIGPGGDGTTHRDIESETRHSLVQFPKPSKKNPEKNQPHAHTTPRKENGTRRGRSRQNTRKGDAPFTKADCNSVTVIDPDLSVSTAENQCQRSGSAPGGGPLCGGGGAAYPGYPPPPGCPPPP